MNFKQPVCEIDPKCIFFEIGVGNITSEHIFFKFAGIERAVKPRNCLAVYLVCLSLRSFTVFKKCRQGDV